MKTLFLTHVLFTASLLLAQTEESVELAPIKVSGDPTEARLPTFSTSATRLDPRDLKERQALHLQDSLGMVPNLNFAGATSRPRYIQLRGVGERSQFAGEGPPNFSVGVLMDEIDLSGLAGAVSLFDAAMVDVLRGPQATLYGSRALAGLLLIHSNPPTPYRENRVQLSAGTDKLIEAGFATSGPWNPDSDTLLYRVSMNILRQDGYRDNHFLDREDTNQRQEFNGRLQFLYRPDDEQRHHLTLMGAQLNNGYDAFATRGDGFTMFSDEPGEDDLSLVGGSLKSRYESWNVFDLISITSGLWADSRYSYDADWGNDAFWAAPPYNFDPEVEGFRYSFTEELERRRRQAGQEFRLQSKPGEGLWNGRSAWSTGLVFTWLEEDDDYQGFSSLMSDYEAVTAGGYGQLTTRLTDALDLVTSLRVENRMSDYSDSEGVEEDTSDWMSGGRVALEADLRENTRGFVGLSRGFKGGGVNSYPNLTADQRVYDPEHLWNLEAGLRHSWAGGRGKAEITLFHMWRRDLQIGTSIQPDPSDPTSFTFFTDNAAEGRNYGAEFELRAPVSNRVELYAALGLLATEYENFQDAGGNKNVEGRDQPHAPSYTFRTGIVVDWTNHWFSRIELEGKDAYFFSDSHDQTSDPYELVHLSLGYRADAWSITLWGKNVLDESYATRGYFFGVEPPNYPSRLWTMRGEPARYGVTWKMEF